MAAAKKSEQTKEGTSQAMQRPPSEMIYAGELSKLRESDSGPKPPGWALSPRAVRTFILGDKALGIRKKFVGNPSLVDRAMVALATNRGLMLVGEPGTAKSLLSELLCRGDLRAVDAHHPGQRRHHRRPDQVLVELRAAPRRGPHAARARARAALRRDARRPDRPLRGGHALPARDPGLAARGALRPRARDSRAGRRRRTCSSRGTASTSSPPPTRATSASTR